MKEKSLAFSGRMVPARPPWYGCSTGSLPPDSGKAFLFGRDVTVDGPYVRARTGVLTETPSLYERLTARKNLSFFGRFYGIPDADIPQRVGKMLSLMDLEDRGDEAVGGFSKGMKQRLAIARALIHDPQVIFLDEPTSGLDPEASRQVDGIIREFASDKGKTIFLCTHNLNQAQHLCSRVAMIKPGQDPRTGQHPGSHGAPLEGCASGYGVPYPASSRSPR